MTTVLDENPSLSREAIRRLLTGRGAGKGSILSTKVGPNPLYEIYRSMKKRATGIVVDDLGPGTARHTPARTLKERSGAV